MIADPLLEGGEACGFDAAGAYTAELLGEHQAAFFEDLQVLRYGGEGDVEGCGEGGDGKGSVAEPVQDRPAGGVAECVKEAIDIDCEIDLGSNLGSNLGFDPGLDLWTDPGTDLGFDPGTHLWTHLWTHLRADLWSGHGSGPFPALADYCDSSVARLSRSLRHPASRIWGPSAPSKNAP